MSDKMRITILPDGSIKVQTDEISAPNHMEAEALLARLEELAGGKTEVEHAGHEHGHTHTHADGTTHQH
jgi:hypothetical protein